MAVATIWSVTLDCADPQPLAQFWAQLLGGTVAHSSADFVGVSVSAPAGAEAPGGLWIGAYRIDGYQPPDWPTGAVGKQFHLDLSVEDMDAAEQAALELGATKSAHQPQPDRWRVLLDPAGHPFCLTSSGAG